MQARMAHPALSIPGAMQALQGLGAAVASTGLGKTLLELVNLRASQLNGCSVCVRMHAADLRKEGESDDRIDTVSAWRDTPYFTDAERAALELTEAVTLLPGRPDPVSDELWAEVNRHYTEQQVQGLLLSISGINVWNRLNAATRQVAVTPRRS
ncbi:carboxymuconolactone decarboxylase family protein [Catellatospora sp. KI3]|uniref:carboxymuconolactone decarboxylase family protein n=1 Tax=Catellatospora sp. KI3 TaxID=3041620 RepID=UPI0024822262|nr:carboxymuconolactone decarboxylase family protein [Catellatospora sp. KI3]MDI1465867.1 carboxymuconolactone decarboxylase family protein [Catellatospora sp. KI3]